MLLIHPSTSENLCYYLFVRLLRRSVFVRLFVKNYLTVTYRRGNGRMGLHDRVRRPHMCACGRAPPEISWLC